MASTDAPGGGVSSMAGDDDEQPRVPNPETPAPRKNPPQVLDEPPGRASPAEMHRLRMEELGERTLMGLDL